MALLYSYQNQPPVPLPDRFRMADGLTRRPPLTDEELGELGWAGPIAIPSYDSDLQVLEWDVNDMEYVVRDLAPQELEQRSLEKAKTAADFAGFYDALIAGAAYQAIRSEALNSLALTVACTEFIAAVSDAKMGRGNLNALQACVNNILAASTLTDDDLQEIYVHMAAHGIWGLLNLGEFSPFIPETVEPPAPGNGEVELDLRSPEPETELVDDEQLGDTILDDYATTGNVMTATSLFGGMGEDTISF